VSSDKIDVVTVRTASRGSSDDDEGVAAALSFSPGFLGGIVGFNSIEAGRQTIVRVTLDIEDIDRVVKYNRRILKGDVNTDCGRVDRIWVIRSW
jgi:hypothetical protein